VTAAKAPNYVLIDSSGWLEYLTDGSKADDFAPFFEESLPILVPTLVLFEVRKQLLRGFGKAHAEKFLSQALRQTVVPLDEQVALATAEATLAHDLAMTDAVIYTTARLHNAELVTADPAFKGLPDVTLL